MKQEYEKPTVEVVEVQLCECFAGSFGIGSVETGSSLNEVEGDCDYENWQ